MILAAAKGVSGSDAMDEQAVLDLLTEMRAEVGGWRRPAEVYAALTLLSLAGRLPCTACPQVIASESEENTGQAARPPAEARALTADTATARDIPGAAVAAEVADLASQMAAPPAAD